MSGWKSGLTRQMVALLKPDGHNPRSVGAWRVWLARTALRHAKAVGLNVTLHSAGVQ